MTQQEVTQHPFFQKFQQRIGVVINALQQRGQINPNEANMLVQLLRNSFPQIHQFIEGLNLRYPQEMTDQQMDQEIYNWLNAPMQQVRARMAQMTGGFGMGFNPGVAGGGMWGGGGPRPSGFGYDRFAGRPNNGIPTSPFGGTGRDPFQEMPVGVTGDSIFGGGSGQSAQRQAQVKEALKPKVDKPVAPPSWKTPEVVDEKSFDLGSVSMQITKFGLSTGDNARRIIIHDPKVGYTSDHEIIEKYKGVFSLFPDARRKFLTVAYQQLKVVPVGHDEFMKMAQALSIAVNKANDVESKLRAIIATSSNFNMAAYSAFNNLFLDELEMHIQCGELCDSAHPKNILNRPDKIDDVLAWVTGDINKDMLAAMKGMTGFCDRLEELLSVIIENVVASLPKLIVDTTNDMTVLDDFYRALPGIWTSDCGITFQNTQDLVNIFIATRETVDSSKSASAVKNESVLKQELNKLSKQFSMIFLPRVVTWCNYSKADVCRYDENGNCQPACYSKLQPRNDVEFFVEESLEKWDISRDTKYRWSPKNIYMEIDEETYCLQYGRTTDGQPFICSVKYWH